MLKLAAKLYSNNKVLCFWLPLLLSNKYKQIGMAPIKKQKVVLLTFWSKFETKFVDWHFQTCGQYRCGEGKNKM